jgi:hypothetical protein
MRFRGGGVGHKSTREATNFFKKDRDCLDVEVMLDIDDVAIELDGDDEPENDEIVDEDTVNQQEEDDYGYTKEYSDKDGDGDGEGAQDEEVDTDEDLGPEDDGGAVDPFMDELGYADM